MSDFNVCVQNRQLLCIVFDAESLMISVWGLTSYKFGINVKMYAVYNEEVSVTYFE